MRQRVLCSRVRVWSFADEYLVAKNAASAAGDEGARLNYERFSREVHLSADDSDLLASETGANSCRILQLGAKRDGAVILLSGHNIIETQSKIFLQLLQ